MKDRIILLGDSPFLKEIEDILHYILELYPVMGINRVINKCRVDMHVLTDEKVLSYTNKYKDIPTLAPARYADLIVKENKILFDTFAYKKDYCIKKDGKLAWCGFTHDYAISYLITQGYKEIILIGAADFVDGKHYSNEKEFERSQKLQNKSISFIEDCDNMYCTIKTCNPNSQLKNIKCVDIKELFNT